MSLLPLPKVRCGTVKPRKQPADVTGTPNVAFGHRLLERSNCHVTKADYKGGSFFDRQEERPEEKREYEQLLKTLDFEKHTDRRIRKKKAWQRVQQGMAAYEDSVNSRREKLRELIFAEEEGLTREVVDQAQLSDDARVNEMRLRSQDLRKQQEEKRLAVVAAKRMQQYLARCPEIREKITKKSVLDAKTCNMAQMAENEAKKQAENELDNLWHQLMLKEVEAKKQREVEELKKRSLVQREAVATLTEQMAGKLCPLDEKKQTHKEERENLERLWESVRQEELKNLERERRNRENLKRDLEEQILIAKRALAKRAREEAEIDRAMSMIAQAELAKERSGIKESSAALRKELLAYLQYLEDVRREEVRRDLEVDAIVAQSTKDAHARRDLAVKKFKEARQRGLEEVLRGREQQLMIKREEERRELELQRAEREMLEREIELDAKLTAHHREETRRRALSYRRDLEEQRRYADDMRRREVEETEKALREDSKREEEYQRLTEELLEASENITPHPFKALLKECAARYAAEKQGHCYCPPPLPPE